jgi:hypothetical protein
VTWIERLGTWLEVKKAVAKHLLEILVRLRDGAASEDSREPGEDSDEKKFSGSAPSNGTRLRGTPASATEGQSGHSFCGVGEGHTAAGGSVFAAEAPGISAANVFARGGILAAGVRSAGGGGCGDFVAVIENL